MVIWLITEYANGKFQDKLARYQKLQDQGASAWKNSSKVEFQVGPNVAKM